MDCRSEGFVLMLNGIELQVYISMKYWFYSCFSSDSVVEVEFAKGPAQRASIASIAGTNCALF